jgi:hypothetical protein
MSWTTAWGGGALDKATLDAEFERLDPASALEAFDRLGDCFEALKEDRLELLLGTLRADEVDRSLAPQVMILRLRLGGGRRLLLAVEPDARRLTTMGVRGERGVAKIARLRAEAVLRRRVLN